MESSPSDDNEVGQYQALWTTITEFSLSRTLIKTSLLFEERVYDQRGAFFKVPVKKGGWKLIIFGRFEAEVKIL